MFTRHCLEPLAPLPHFRVNEGASTSAPVKNEDVREDIKTGGFLKFGHQEDIIAKVPNFKNDDEEEEEIEEDLPDFPSSDDEEEEEVKLVLRDFSTVDTADEAEELEEDPPEFPSRDVEGEVSKDLEEERKHRAALEEALEKEQSAKAEQDRALQQLREEKDALTKTLKGEQAEKAKLLAEDEQLKERVTRMKNSWKELQLRKQQLKETIFVMKDELRDNKTLIKKLKEDLESSALQHKEETEKREAELNSFYREIKELKERLAELHEGSRQKGDKIQTLQLSIKTLQSDNEEKGSTVSSLQERLKQLASQLEEEKTKTCNFQRECEATGFQQQKEAEKVQHLSQENQKLTYENKRLQTELQTAANKREPDENTLQQEANSRLEEAVKKEKARFAKACQKIKMQEKELSEKALALEKSVIVEKMLRSSLKSEKKRFDQVVSQQRSAVDPATILSVQLKEASAASEHLKYDMQTLRMENADIRAKFEVKDREYDRVVSKYQSLFESHQEMKSKTSITISENQNTIAKLQSMVEELKEKLADNNMRQAGFEFALNDERTRSSLLEQRVERMRTALEHLNETSEKHRSELKVALKEQIALVEENKKLSTDLREAQDSYSRLVEKHSAESSFQERHIGDVKLRSEQQKTALDHTTTVMLNLQQEYTELIRRHSDLHCQQRELLKSYTALQVKYERLSYAQGNRPELCPPLYTVR